VKVDNRVAIWDLKLYYHDGLYPGLFAIHSFEQALVSNAVNVRVKSRSISREIFRYS